jgi:ArsR family transcriptional regulator
LPIDDGTCDATLLLLALTYVPHPAAVVREMARVLKPGGRAVLVDLLPHARDDFRRQMGQRHMGFDRAEVETTMREAGLTPTAFRPLPPEPGVKGPALFLVTGETR